MTEIRFRQAFLLLRVTAISAELVAMIRAFLLAILLAAIDCRDLRSRAASGPL